MTAVRVALVAAIAITQAAALQLVGSPPVPRTDKAPPAQLRLDRRAACFAALGLVAGQPPAATAADDTSSVFVGRYSDPNHPGGFREISLVPGSVGSYKLANVHGGEGRGEPASYDLPAIIVERGAEQKQIIIDFSAPPKNGPRDFAGVWDAKANGIRFVRDGNFWPRQ